MLGFDSLYENRYADIEIIDRALLDKRIILTKDRGILKHGRVTHGYWVRSEKPRMQTVEIISRLDLFSRIKPFSRCMQCNGLLEKAKKEDIMDSLEPRTIELYDEYCRCQSCGKVYWKGSHYENMKHFIDMATQHASAPG